MRLTCPNCDAQYEVPDDVIPPEGRDVQCSNCGNTWFQAGSAAAETVEAEDDMPEPGAEWAPEIPADETLEDVPETSASPNEAQTQDGPVTMSADAPDAVLAEAVKAAIRRARPEAAGQVIHRAELSPEPAIAQPDQQFEDELDAALNDVEPASEPEQNSEDTSPDSERSSEDEIYFEPTYEGEDNEEAPQETETPARRTIDPTVANILQEEAAFEADRRAEETGLESQPDLGLEEPQDDAAKRAKQARERMARMRGLPTDAAERPSEPIPANSRRDLLPDIEEINSTLRATEDRTPEEQPDGRPTASQRRAGGRRMGFALAILLVAGGVFIYSSPDKVSETIPGSENVVAAYVNFVDGARLQLDTQMTKLMIWLDGLSSEG